MMQDREGKVNPKSKIQNLKSVAIAPNSASISSTISAIGTKFWRNLISVPTMW